MAGLKFEISKVKKVVIDKIRPNTWNPKDKGTEDFEKIKKGIKLKGLRIPIVVRENNGYEIIDGEQRYTACKELGFKEVLIYDEGKVSDQEAKELTIWYQQQVPFEEIKLAELVTDIVKNEDFELPYSDDEIQTYKEMFDFDNYESDRPEDDKKEEKEELHECPKCGHKF